MTVPASINPDRRRRAAAERNRAAAAYRHQTPIVNELPRRWDPDTDTEVVVRP